MNTLLFAQDLIKTKDGRIAGGFNMFIQGARKPTFNDGFSDISERLAGFNKAEEMAKEGKIFYTEKIKRTGGLEWRERMTEYWIGVMHAWIILYLRKDTNIMPEKLKSCPFCGGGAVVYQIGTHNFVVNCKGCGIELPTSDAQFTSGENAITAWNKRVQPTSNRRGR